MKHVFPNHQVAHVWAQQSKECTSGRSGNGNLSFEGDTLYSYTTPIARIVTGRGKVKAMLLTSQSFSVTTEGKHKNAAWRAWHGNGPSFTVPFLGVTGGRAFRHPHATDMREVHKGNRDALLKGYQEFVAREMRAVNNYWSTQAKALEAFKDQANKVYEYCAWAGLKAPAIDHEANALKAWERYERLNAMRATPEYRAKQERARERREEKAREEQERAMIAAYSGLQDQFVRYMTRSEGYNPEPSFWNFPADSPERAFLENATHERNIAKGLANHEAFTAWRDGSGPIPENLSPWFAYASDEKNAWAEGMRAKIERDNAEKIEAWRNGAGSAYLYITGFSDCTFMRIRGDNIETSRGAAFPVSHGVRAWPFILRARGKGWKANGHSIALGHFHIDEIEPNGNVRAGCHYVPFAEVSRVADQLRAAGYELAETIGGSHD